MLEVCRQIFNEPVALVGGVPKATDKQIVVLFEVELGMKRLRKEVHPIKVIFILIDRLVQPATNQPRQSALHILADERPAVQIPLIGRFGAQEFFPLIALEQIVKSLRQAVKTAVALERVLLDIALGVQKLYGVLQNVKRDIFRVKGRRRQQAVNFDVG